MQILNQKFSFSLSEPFVPSSPAYTVTLELLRPYNFSPNTIDNSRRQHLYRVVARQASSLFLRTKCMPAEKPSSLRYTDDFPLNPLPRPRYHTRSYFRGSGRPYHVEVDDGMRYLCYIPMVSAILLARQASNPVRPDRADGAR